MTEDSDREAESDNEEAYANDSESTTVIQKEVQTPCHYCESSNVCGTAVMKCPKCDHEIPMDRKHMKEAFARCYDYGAVRYGKMNKSNDNLYSPHNDQED